ncbi:MAG: hypothetical protein H0U40_03635 [Chloroflexia bacterium]|nr:hypothetical protein [Chloroflexia bacterium]
MARTSAMTSPAVGDAAPDATLIGADGGPRALRGLWEASPRGATVVFLRQFG